MTLEELESLWLCETRVENKNQRLSISTSKPGNFSQTGLWLRLKANLNHDTHARPHFETKPGRFRGSRQRHWPALASTAPGNALPAPQTHLKGLG